MEKVLLKNNSDLIKVINQFGKEWEEDIKNEISIYPCVLIASFSDDIEFGEVYRFSSVTKLDFSPFFFKLNRPQNI